MRSVFARRFVADYNGCMSFRLSALAMAFLFSLFAQGQTTQYFYTYEDSSGKKLINNLPPDHMKGKGYRLIDVRAGSVRPAITNAQMSRVLRSPELISLVDKISADHGVDTWLVRAVIQAESAFYERARSRAGALGLMQLIPATAARFGVVDPFDPTQNITGGVKYLRWLMDHFNNDFTKVIAAYNAGENAVKKYNGIPPYAETRAYVPKVMNLWKNKSVVPDPRAQGSIDYLNRGSGGFAVATNGTGNADDANGANSNSTTHVAQKPAPRTPMYSWEDAHGRISITDKAPPKGAKNVKVYY